MNYKTLINRITKRGLKSLIDLIFFLKNKLIYKQEDNILFIPHYNSNKDNYDILNADSDNVLSLFLSIIKDPRLRNKHLYLGYYNTEKLNLYKQFCAENSVQAVSFFKVDNLIELYNAFCKCPLIFTDEIFRNYPIKTKKQTIVCLNYYAGFMKNDFFKIKNHGGYNQLKKEQNRIYKYYDYILSTSDLSCMFLTVEDCVYYGNTLPLGFPRNDIFFQDNSNLKNQLKSIIDVEFENIITYVPTHRDYENIDRKDFYDPKSCKPRTIFGVLSEDEIRSIDNTLENTKSIIIAKVHPVQAKSNIEHNKFKRVIYYHDLAKKITTSLNPLLAITDCLLTDYTTAVYDFAYMDKPIIYYFYDIEKYTKTRGLFLNPIDPICMGKITYNVNEMCIQIKNFALGHDEFKEKRRVISNLLIKYKDGNSSERIKNFFLLNKSKEEKFYQN